MTTAEYEQHSYALRVYCWATVQGLQL